MKGRTVLITGGSAGIGLQTAKELAKMGAHLILVARSEEKLKTAAAEVAAFAGGAKVKYYVCNLSSMKSIRQLAAQVKQDYTQLDVLINNAGGVFDDFTLSEDGLEMTIATNHFAYFLLTQLLLDVVTASDYARIVNVSSNSHYSGKIDFDSFTQNKSYFVMSAYAQSKLANVLFTKVLAQRLAHTHVTVNALHPGMVKTDIGTKGTKWYSSAVWKLLTGIAGISLESGAKTSVFLASASEVKGKSGGYYDKCKLRQPSALALNNDLAEQLWQYTEAYLAK